MASKKSIKLSTDEVSSLIQTLKTRFAKNLKRHEGLVWDEIESRLVKQTDKLWSLYQMEETGGEPDVVGYDKTLEVYVFMDCCAESPARRRSLCYDQEALDSRKENKPAHSAMEMAYEMGIAVLNEEDYNVLQSKGAFDTKTSSWLQTPDNIRALGGAIFGDWRYGQVFIYHNGASSYYAARGFRGKITV